MHTLPVWQLGQKPFNEQVADSFALARAGLVLELAQNSVRIINRNRATVHQLLESPYTFEDTFWGHILVRAIRHQYDVGVYNDCHAARLARSAILVFMAAVVRATASSISSPKKLSGQF